MKTFEEVVADIKALGCKWRQRATGELVCANGDCAVGALLRARVPSSPFVLREPPTTDGGLALWPTPERALEAGLNPNDYSQEVLGRVMCANDSKLKSYVGTCTPEDIDYIRKELLGE